MARCQLLRASRYSFRERGSRVCLEVDQSLYLAMKYPDELENDILQGVILEMLCKYRCMVQTWYTLASILSGLG